MKLTGESSKTEADLLAEVVAVEETRNAKRARVERLERNVAGDAKKRQMLLAKRLWTSETVSCHLVKTGESLPELQFKVITFTAKLRECCELVTKIPAELKVAKGDFLL